MHQRIEPLVAGEPAGEEAAAEGVEHPRHRRDEPSERSRPGAPPSGPLRPVGALRPSEPVGPPGNRRLLPRPQGARPRPRPAGAPRPARGDDARLLAGDDRARARRSARLDVARCPRRDELGRRAAGEAHRRDRAQATGRVQRGREAHDRDPRGGTRRRRLPGRSEPQAGGPLDHQATRRLGSPRAHRHRRALHAHALRAPRVDEDRFRWHDRRRAVLRRVGHRSGRRPGACDACRRADGRLVRHGGIARVLRGGRTGADCPGHRRQGAGKRRSAARRRETPRAVQAGRLETRRPAPASRDRAAGRVARS